MCIDSWNHQPRCECFTGFISVNSTHCSGNYFSHTHIHIYISVVFIYNIILLVTSVNSEEIFLQVFIRIKHDFYFKTSYSSTQQRDTMQDLRPIYIRRKTTKIKRSNNKRQTSKIIFAFASA